MSSRHQYNEQNQNNTNSNTNSGMSSTTTEMSNNNNSRQRMIDGYIILSRLGVGSFATVYKGIKKQPQQNLHDDSSSSQNTVAIKVISRKGKMQSPKIVENLEMEITILKEFRHPNIVALHNVRKTEGHFYLFLEYCGGGDLQKLIRSRKTKRLSERLTRRLMRDLVSGLKYLWGMNVMHRDIKPQNLLLTGPLPLDEENDPGKTEQDEEYRQKVNFPSHRFALKIADFGFARPLAVTSLAETLCGSPLYMAPEILQGNKYNAKADLWSVGTVLFEMIAGCPPFTGDNHIHLLRNIQTKSVRLPEGVKISQECINVLRHLLHKNPMRRAGFQAFFESADAFVALGCNGQSKKIDSNTTSNSVNFETRRLRSMSTVQESVSSNESSTASVDDEVLQSNSGSNSGPDQNDLRNVQKAPTKYNNSSSNLSGRAQSATKTTVTPPTPPVPINLVQANAMGMNQPTMIPNNSHSQQQQQQKHQLVNSSRKQYYNFTPLTNSPPSINAPITLKMYDSPRNTLSPQSSNLLPAGTSQGSMPQHFLIPNLQRQGNSSLPKRLVKPQHQESNFTNSRNFKATSSQGSESDSEFVMVEHSNTASSIISQNESGYQSVHHSGLQSRGYSNMVHSPSTTPNSPLSPVEERNSNSMKESGILINSQRRSSIQGHTVRRKSAFLSTSPPAGATLISIMTALQNGSTQAPIIKDHTISQCISRLQSIPNGQLRSVKDLELAVRVLATAEDIGRRAVNVAHLGDTRAYHGMRLSLSSSFSSSAQLIEGIEKANPEDQECNSYDRQRKHSTSSNDMSTATTVMSNHRDSTMEEDDDIDDDEMPFAISSDTIEDLPSIGSRAVIPMNTKSNSIHHNKSQSEGLTPPSQKLSYLRGALSCYLKALSFMKYAVKSIQFVMDKVGTEGIDQSNSSKILFANRCQTSLKWLTGQFTGVIERADASSIEVKKLETFLSSQSSNSNISDKQNLGTSMSVQEIVYNHALVYGRDGAVRELLGQHEAARAFYRSAGILAEVLLMESNLGEDDQKTLNDFVDGFWDRMRELDTIVSRKAQSLPLSPSRRGSRSGESVVGLVGGIPNQLQQRRQHNIYG